MNVIILTSILLGSMARVGPCDHAFCSCVVTGDPQPSLDRSAAVFVGRVLAVTGAPGYTGEHSRDHLPLFMKDVTFIVERGWLGSPPDTVRAAIDLTGPDCPTRFVPGAHYLVYSGWREDAYVIGVCTRTSAFDSDLAQADLKALGPPRYERP